RCREKCAWNNRIFSDTFPCDKAAEDHDTQDSDCNMGAGNSEHEREQAGAQERKANTIEWSAHARCMYGNVDTCKPDHGDSQWKVCCKNPSPRYEVGYDSPECRTDNCSQAPCSSD